jgi:hypothetical protein
MAYTEFYCNASTGDNLNAGTTEGSPTLSNTGGSWVQSTRVFTCSGSPDLSGITNSMYASVYADGASAPTGYVAKITAVDDGAKTITLSATILAGTAPTDGTNTRTMQVGGVWKGPNAASGFPFGFVVTALSTATNQNPRVNFKNNATYDITAAMTADDNGPLVWQGYSSTAGDGGKATIDGGTAVAGYVLLTLSGNNQVLADFILQNNGNSGSSTGLVFSGSEINAIKVVVHDTRGAGFGNTGTSVIVECEAYGCNQTNASNNGGFLLTATCNATRCISHNNSGSNSHGFRLSNTSQITLTNCIADTNGSDGFNSACSGATVLISCDSYNNTGDGIDISNSSEGLFYIENCNLIDNGGWGINGSGSSTRNGAVVNCAFGAGTAANASGTTTGLKQMSESGSVTYASNITPWVDPANGDFRINLAAAIGAGRGAFTQTQASYTGASSSPVIGACQVADYPAVGNVANGVTYANGAYTGTSAGGSSGVIGGPNMRGGMMA